MLFHRTTFRGKRIVSVPVKVVLWAIEWKSSLTSLAVVDGETTQLSSPDLDWTVGRCLFKGQYYTAFVNFLNGQRHA